MSRVVNYTVFNVNKFNASNKEHLSVSICNQRTLI